MARRICLSDFSDRRSNRRKGVHGQARRAECFFVLLRILDMNVYECGVWPLSYGAAGARFGLFTHRGLGEGRSLRVESRTDLVGHRNDSGNGILSGRVPLIRRKSVKLGAYEHGHGD
jgi:hypothetical protein